MKKITLLLPLLISSIFALAQFNFNSTDISYVSDTYFPDTKLIDLDGDGDLDVLSCYYRVSPFTGSGIVWYENLGGGSFGGEQIISSMVDQAKSVCPSDIDGDGDMDVISASSNDSKIAWYENLGAGSFSTQQIISTNALGAYSVISVDIDGDGDQDIVSASYSDNKIAWYENLGGGTIGGQQIISSTIINLQSVNSADLDGDGDVDIISVDGNNSWFENIGGGGFSVNANLLSSANLNTRSLSSADINNDGNIDVISSDYDGNIFWYKGLGGGLFDNLENFITPYYDNHELLSIVINDLDGDGDMDILGSRYSRIIYYENLGYCNSDANFTSISNGNGNYSFTNTSTGDFNQSHWAFSDGSINSLTNSNHTFPTNGNFSVVLTINDSISQCIDFFIDTVTVTGISNPLLCNAGYVIFPDTSIYNDVTVLNTSSGNNLSYLWDYGDGNSSSLQNPSHSYTSAGPFYLCLTIDDGNGCNDMYCDSIGKNGVVFNKTGGFTINVISPVAIGIENERILNSVINIYPNPTSNQLTIDTELKLSEITIFDITGKIIMTTNGNTNTINVTALSDGIYFIKIITEERTITKKFVKQ
ncbi:MAG: hypothetical protein COB15_11125 [Flavobacteriales bacterium]|nr:MAG: hypothetical protein COB15_11125 [Flavobacteriales bacterium]